MSRRCATPISLLQRNVTSDKIPPPPPQSGTLTQPLACEYVLPPQEAFLIFPKVPFRGNPADIAGPYNGLQTELGSVPLPSRATQLIQAQM
jgi:hypothetical protein